MRANFSQKIESPAQYVRCYQHKHPISTVLIIFCVSGFGADGQLSWCGPSKNLTRPARYDILNVSAFVSVDSVLLLFYIRSA